MICSDSEVDVKELNNATKVLSGLTTVYNVLALISLN